MKIIAAILSLLLTLSGIGVCMWTDVYLRIQAHAAPGVDPHSWDITGTMMIGIGGMLFTLSVLSMLESKR